MLSWPEALLYFLLSAFFFLFFLTTSAALTHGNETRTPSRRVDLRVHSVDQQQASAVTKERWRKEERKGSFRISSMLILDS